MKTVDVTIKKPMYGTFVYIRDIYIKEAVKKNCLMKITIPQGTALVDPREWVRTGKRMAKVFLHPDNPMILWGNNVPIDTSHIPVIKQEQEATLKLF